MLIPEEQKEETGEIENDTGELQTGQAGQVQDEEKRQVQEQQVIPKTKEDWDKLRTEDPDKWINLTQTRMDQTVRRARELEERLEQERIKNQNLSVEFESLKKSGQKKEEPAPDVNRPFSTDNLPQTNEQWDQLWIENPNLAADLRHHKNEMDRRTREVQTKEQEEFAKAKKESAKMLWDRHPDMYVLERDETGNMKVDGNGKPVLKLDPRTGSPFLDLESEKGKLFVEVYNEDPHGYDGAKFGPRLAMIEMERRIRERAEQKVSAGSQVPGESQTTEPDQRGVLPGGVLPPATAKVSFNSKEEREHAEKAVQRGIYKDLGEYCQLRDGERVDVTEVNSVPRFG